MFLSKICFFFSFLVVQCDLDTFLTSFLRFTLLCVCVCVCVCVCKCLYTYICFIYKFPEMYPSLCVCVFLCQSSNKVNTAILSAFTFAFVCVCVLSCLSGECLLFLSLPLLPFLIQSNSSVSSEEWQQTTLITNPWRKGVCVCVRVHVTLPFPLLSHNCMSGLQTPAVNVTGNCQRLSVRQKDRFCGSLWGEY